MVNQIQQQLNDICNIITSTIPTKEIYLFGSFAYGNPTTGSDFDLFVVVPDDGPRSVDAIKQIRRALYKKQPMPLDILVSHAGDFARRREGPCLEGTIYTKGAAGWITYTVRNGLHLPIPTFNRQGFLTQICPQLLEVICYHCEQAVEKLLKEFFCLSWGRCPQNA